MLNTFRNIRKSDRRKIIRRRSHIFRLIRSLIDHLNNDKLIQIANPVINENHLILRKKSTPIIIVNFEKMKLPAAILLLKTIVPFEAITERRFIDAEIQY